MKRKEPVSLLCVLVGQIVAHVYPQEILKILLRDEQLGGDVDVQKLAKRTPLFSGSDLKRMCSSCFLRTVVDIFL